MRKSAAIGLFIGAAWACMAVAGRAADKPDAQAVYVVGEMRVQTMGPVTLAYVETETTFDKLGETIGEAIPKVTKAAEAGKVKVSGPFVLAYPKGAHQDPAQRFTVQIGLVVAPDGARADRDVKVRKVEPFKCATVVYSGPVTEMGQAYVKLFAAIEAAGLKLTGEEREYTLYYESPESANNVVLVQVGVK